MTRRQADRVPAAVRAEMQGELQAVAPRAWALLAEAVTLRAVHDELVRRALKAADSGEDVVDTFFDDVGLNGLWRPMQLAAATLLDHPDAVGSLEEVVKLAEAAGASTSGDIAGRVDKLEEEMDDLVSRLRGLVDRLEPARVSAP